MERLKFSNVNKDLLYHEIGRLFLEKYVYAYRFAFKKTILDAGCGDGMCSYILSLAAKRIIAVDHNKNALNTAKKLKFHCPIKFIHDDLNKMKLPETDLCVALEVLEHLKPGNDFLKRLPAKLLVYSLPINHGGKYHLQIFPTIESIKKYIESQGWKLVDFFPDRELSNVYSNISKANECIIGLAERK